MYRRPPNPSFKIFYWSFDRRFLSGGRNLNLESVGWNDDSRRLARSQRHLRDLSLRFMFSLFEQDHGISKSYLHTPPIEVVPPYQACY